MFNPEDEGREELAESMMSDEQRASSERREAAYHRSKLGEWSEEDGTLLFNIDEDLISSEALEQLGPELHVMRKPEFHVTIFGYGTGREIQNALESKPADEQPALRHRVQDIVESLNEGWNADTPILKITKNYSPEPGKTGAKKEKRTSLIQMVEFPNIEKVFAEINELLGLKLEVPPTHITIMTGSTNPENMTRGIGLPARGTLKSLNPEQVWPEYTRESGESA